jgi:hypothetical protein
MIVLALAVAINAWVHGLLVSRFGDGPYAPFLVFACVDAALAVALFFRIPYVLWATLILCTLEFIRVAITFNKAERDKHLDKEILITNGGVVLGAAYLLIAG